VVDTEGRGRSLDDTGGVVPVFEEPPLIVRFLDSTEEEIRKRVARLKLVDRLLLLERDWLTRITMLMILLSLLWGAIGGFDAFGSRTQVTAWALGQPLHLSNQEIYSSITLHGVRMLFGFAQQLEFALFGLLAINAIGVTPRHKWVLYASVALINVSMIFMEGPVYLLPAFNDNYFPAIGWYFLAPLGIQGSSSYVVSPLWYLGWICLCLSALLWASWVLSHVVGWLRKPGGTKGRQLPAFLLFIIGSAVLIPISYATLLASTIWDVGAYLWSWPLNALANQVLFWMFGHGIVYILFLIPVTAYYLLVPILARRPIYSYRAAFAAAVMFVVLTPILAIHHLYLTPVPAWSVWLSMVLTFAIILPSAITFFSVWMTLKGVRPKDWEWNTVSLFLLLSFAGSIAGGLTGPDNNTPAWDVDLHNTLFIVSHFHTFTVLSITAGGMALAYAFFPVLVGRFWYSPWLSRIHFVGTAVGGAGMVVFWDYLGNLGVLRREVLVPAVGAIPLDELGLTVAIVIILVAQLFFLLNALLTVFFGGIVSAEGLQFGEVVRAAAQSTYPHPTMSIQEHPLPRTVPRARRERIEITWVGSVIALLIVVIAVTTPSALSTSEDISAGQAAPAGAVYVTMAGQQYYWSVHESGPVSGQFDNVVVAHAGEWVSVNATATGATQGLYIPFRAQPTVNVQVVPGDVSHALFQAPSSPGVYGVPDGEYDGPWFGQDVAALVVLPAAVALPEGDPSSTLASFQANGGAGDVFNPPVWNASGAQLVGDQEGLFNGWVPGPTLAATAGPVAFSWTVPMSSIGIDNYLVNVTSNDPNAQAAWVSAHNDTLPQKFVVEQILPSTGLVPVASSPLVVGPTVPVQLNLSQGVYLYGVTTPVDYSYDPDGQSSSSTGAQTGWVMGMWGVLWVGAA
jgi:heme/copper-type cytochrome/quinol oxidase subunit 1